MVGGGRPAGVAHPLVRRRRVICAEGRAGMMDAAGLLDELGKQGELMAEAVARLAPGAPVPTCPEWDVRELTHHTGRVHRWATGVVAQAQARPWSDLDLIIPDGWPPPERLADWLREGLAGLTGALGEAPDDLRCWTFFGDPRPKDFWTRRMAHETAVHRWDAQLAAGTEPDGFSPQFAADGTDELLTMFVERTRGKSAVPFLTAPRPVTLHVAALDAQGRWTVAFGPEGASGRRGGEAREADCAASGPAGSLYPFLWNRASPADIRVEGDLEVLEWWRKNSSF